MDLKSDDTKNIGDGSSSSSSPNPSMTLSQANTQPQREPNDSSDDDSSQVYKPQDQCRPSLHSAVSSSNIPQIEKMLDSGADPNEIDKDGKKPIYYSCRQGHNLSITSLLLRHGASMCDSMDWEAKRKVLEVAFRRLDPEKDEAALLRLLQDSMDDINRKSIERRTVVCLVAWLYIKIFWIIAYIFLVVLETSNRAAAVYLYLGWVWFAVTEVTEFQYLVGQGAEFVYLQDMWRWIHIATYALVFLTTTMSIRGDTLPTDTDDGLEDGRTIVYQRLVSTSIGLLCISLLGDMKTTFLPFSIFVGGVAQIFYDVIPFIDVTFMVLFAFALMYYIQGPSSYGNEIDDGSIKDAFFHVFSGFTGGLEDAGSLLDLLFGVVLVIILFNVVIAIVSSSWQNAVNSSFINLCKHRVEAIRGAEIDKKTDEKCCRNNCCWDNDWMDHEYWFDRFDDRWNAFERNSRIEQNTSKEAKTVYKFVVPVMRGLFLFGWGILGLLTFGFFWPPRIRKRLFEIPRHKDTIGTSMMQAVQQTKRNGSEITDLSMKIQQQRSVMEQRIERLETKIDDVTAKLDLVLGCLMAKDTTSSPRAGTNELLPPRASNEISPQKK